MVKNLEFLRNSLEKENTIIIDARSEDRFNSVALEPRKGIRSEHIPKSINNSFKKVLDNGIYKSINDLKKSI